MRSASYEHQFIRLVELATALSLGLMTGFLFSIHRVNPRIEFAITSWSFISCIISGVLFWMAAHLFFRRLLETRDSDGSVSLDRKRLLSRWLLFFSVALLLEAFLGVAHGLKGIDPGKLGEVLQGMVFALFVLGITGFIFWKLTRFVERDQPPPHLRDDQAE